MISLTSSFNLIEARAETLSALVAIGFFVGEFLARGPLTQLLAFLAQTTRRLGHKLDRENRSIATRVYRGIIAVLMLVFPAIIAAAALSQYIPWVKLLAVILLVAWFGYCFATIGSIVLLRRAKRGGLPLELPNLNYLFADTHAVIRHLITTRIQAFAIGVVGGCFWYVVGGLVGMAMYLSLAAANSAYHSRAAFGWAARSLFCLANALPALFTRVLIFLASLFTPHSKPLKGLFAPDWQTAFADTLDIALGGPTPNGDMPWVGQGTARLTPNHLQRAMQLLAVATVLLVLLLAHQHLYNILIKFI